MAHFAASMSQIVCLSSLRLPPTGAVRSAEKRRKMELEEKPSEALLDKTGCHGIPSQYLRKAPISQTTQATQPAGPTLVWQLCVRWTDFRSTGKPDTSVAWNGTGMPMLLAGRVHPGGTRELAKHAGQARALVPALNGSCLTSIRCSYVPKKGNHLDE